MKIKKDSAAIIIAVILIFAYIFYQCYSVFHISFETETALLSTAYEKIDATALVIRDERIISSDKSKVTVPCLSDGDKINVGGNIAMNFSSGEDAKNYAKYLEIEKSLKNYESLESQTVGRAANVESINSEIDDDVNSFVRSADSQNVGIIDANAQKLGDDILRRQMIIGENVDLLSIIQKLRKQADKYSSSKPDSYISTKVSGVFSSYTDGFEKIVKYDKAPEMSIDDINKALKKINNSKIKENDNLGKLITSYNWYFACVVDSKEVMNLEDGQRVQVALKNSDGAVLNVQIVSGAQPDVGKEKTALILKANAMDSKLASLREEEIEIRTGSLEGIRLHISEGKKGVYALVSSQVKFREAEVIYSEGDWVMLSYDPDSSNGIRLYDQIITQGKELKDGKVYT